MDRMNKDISKAAITLGQSEARFLVDTYYIMQEQRKRSANQVRALSETNEPNSVISWLFEQNRVLENQIKLALGKYAAANKVGSRMLSVVGIGPVITAGLLAHIDIRKAPTVGHIWRYAGLDPTMKWEKGQKRPWNAQLKTLCWKIGESFVKVKGKETAYYGHVYAQRKDFESGNNMDGLYKEQALSILKSRPTHAQKDTYAKGILPDGHIHARAKRYAVKLFLAHLHEVWYREEYGIMPQLPYPIAHLGHVHKKEPPF